MNVIDLHCHILPGLDDGSEGIEQSLQMARQLQNAGFSHIIATPHVLEGRDFLTPDTIRTATEDLNFRLKEEGIELEVLPGAENYIFPEMAGWLAAGKLLTLADNGKYMLVELPMMEVPYYTEQVFFELQVAGVRPILAHPERNLVLGEKPEMLVEWANKGVLFQLDLRSVGGRYGAQAKELADRMLASGLVHFIGTDLHRAISEESLLKNLAAVRELAGEEGLRALSTDNAGRVLEGAEIEIRQSYKLREQRQPSLGKRLSSLVRSAISKG